MNIEEKDPAPLNIPQQEKPVNSDYPFSDVKYICQSTSLITEAIQKGFDIAQLPNGDITVTEIQTVTVNYTWNATKQKFIKVTLHSSSI